MNESIKRLRYAQKQLKPLKRKDINGDIVIIKIDTTDNLSRILKVTRQMVHKSLTQSKKYAIL